MKKRLYLHLILLGINLLRRILWHFQHFLVIRMMILIPQTRRIHKNQRDMTQTRITLGLEDNKGLIML